MEYTIQLNSANGLVLVHAAGEWESDKDNLMVQQIMQTVIESGLHRILLDIRELKFDLSMAHIFERAIVMRDARMKQDKVSSRVALVYDAQNQKLEADMRFFETAAQNRSVPYRVFKTIEEARSWLLKT
ncbi:MAG: hypothetical protein U0X74_11310 [Anaerolineales bacterium]